MEISPYFGEQVITASNVEVRVNSDDRKRALALVERTKAVTEVSNDETFTEARRAAGELKAMLDEIELSRKQAKTPFTTVGRTIDDVAHRVADPILNEHKRILELLNAHVAKLEAARRELERQEAENRRSLQEEADRRVREATTDEERQIAELAKDLALDIEELGKEAEPPQGLVPGGRVDHVYEFQLVDVAATVAAGCWRLLRWELDLLACRDAVKNLIECAPNVEPELPGIKITKRINVSVKAASRIR